MDLNLSNLDFQQMGGWSNPVKIIFSVLICAVILVGGWFWLIQSKSATLVAEEARERDLLHQFEDKQGKVVNLNAYKAQLDEMRELLRQMLRQLPSKTEMPDLLVDISQTALSTGIDNQKFQPGVEVIREFYAEKPISLRMVGTYHQFGAFVSKVASLPRVVILNMQDISLRPLANDKRPNTKNAATVSANGESLLVLEGTVKTYRYVEEEELQQRAAAKRAAVKRK